MHYLIDMGDGETYAVCNSGTVRWISDRPLQFSVVAYAGFNDEDVIVYANGKTLAPDVGGFYTLQKSDETVMITAAGAVKDDSAPPAESSPSGSCPSGSSGWNPVEIWYTLFVTLPKKTGSIFI